ncbi:hypothetical protein FIM08_03840 [SAR202 cluster bacterium AC-647-N09_OGT_505m]|nr:hypothetical protein [SAR202 cluster bacterium AC-647-N09_OGT_505m]
MYISSSAVATVRQLLQRVLVGLFLLIVLLAVACGGSDPTPTTNPSPIPTNTPLLTHVASPAAEVATSVTLSPNSPILTAGQTRLLVATAKDAAGVVLADLSATWSTSNQSVATVSADGLVTGISPGSVIVTVSTGGVIGTSSITVSEAKVGSIAVNPQSATLITGQTQKLTATLKDVQGNVVASQTIVWESSTRSSATVSTTGLVTGIAPGTSTITATAYGKTATAVISVTQATIANVTLVPESHTVTIGQIKQMSVSVRDTHGNVIKNLPVDWSSSKMSVATVSATGLVSAIASGTSTVTATVSGVSDTTIVTVTVIPASSVTVSPQSPNVTTGQTQQLISTMLDANGNVIAGQTVSWSSSNPSSATVSDIGLVTGIAPGTSTVTATSGGVTGTALITVTEASIASVTVTPSLYVLTAGSIVKLSATLKDTSGNEITGRAVTWSSSDPSVATVSDTGFVNSKAQGSATITATAEGISATASIEVVELAY